MSKKNAPTVPAVEARGYDGLNPLSKHRMAGNMRWLFVNVIFGQSYTKTAYLRPVVQRRLLDGIRSSALPFRLGIACRFCLP